MTPKFIKELGQRPIGKKDRKEMFWLVECPDCSIPYEARASTVRSGKSTRCKLCGYKEGGRKQVEAQSNLFVGKAVKVHGDKYGYSSVRYKANDKPVKIFCNNCKDHFLQQPQHHIQQKSGCPKCRHGSDNDMLYIWTVVGTNTRKIGITSKRLGIARIKFVAGKLSTFLGYNVDYTIDCLIPVCNATVVEAKLLQKFDVIPKDIENTFNGASDFRYMNDVEAAINIIMECLNE